MNICGMCQSYGVQTVATVMDDDEIEVCFECIEGEEAIGV